MIDYWHLVSLLISFSFFLFFTALADHSVTCSEKFVNLHEAALEEIEKESKENGKLMLSASIL